MSRINSFIKPTFGRVSAATLPSMKGIKDSITNWVGRKVTQKDTSSTSQSDEQMKALQRTLLGKDSDTKPLALSSRGMKISNGSNVPKKIIGVFKQIIGAFQKKEVKPKSRSIDTPETSKNRDVPSNFLSSHARQMEVQQMRSVQKALHEKEKEEFGTDGNFISIDHLMDNLDFGSNTISPREEQFLRFAERQLPSLNKAKIGYEMMERIARKFNSDFYPKIELEIGGVAYQASDLRGQDYKFIVRASGIEKGEGLLKMFDEHKLWGPNFCASVISDDIDYYMANETIGFVMAVDPKNIYLTNPTDIQSPTYNPSRDGENAKLFTTEFNATYRKLTVVNAYIEQISKNAGMGDVKNNYIKAQRLRVFQEQLKIEMEDLAEKLKAMPIEKFSGSERTTMLQKQEVLLKALKENLMTQNEVKTSLNQMEKNHEHLKADGQLGSFVDALSLPEFTLKNMIDHYQNQKWGSQEDQKVEYQRIFEREGSDIVEELKKSLDLISNLQGQLDKTSESGENFPVFRRAFRPILGPDEILSETMRPSFQNQHGRLPYNELNIHLEKEDERKNRPSEVSALIISQASLASCESDPKKMEHLQKALNKAKEMNIPILIKSSSEVKNQQSVHQVQITPTSDSKANITSDPDQKMVKQKMVKQMKGTVSYEYNAPKVDIPEHFEQTMTTEELGKLKAACMSDYKSAMQAMEESVADVASTHNDAMQFAKTLSGRLLKFVEAYAEVQLEAEERITKTTPENVKNAEITKKVNSFLVDIFSETKQTTGTLSDGKAMAQGSIQKGISHEAGNVGMNPLTIRKAITEGNLREMMYFPYKTTWDFTNAILKDYSLTEKVNQKLQEKGAGFEVNLSMLKEVVVDRNLPPYFYTEYANSTRNDGLRAFVPQQEREKMMEENNKPINSKRRIDLSEREKKHAVGELNPKTTKMPEQMKHNFEAGEQEPIKWTPGSYWYRPTTNSEKAAPHEYLTATENIQTPSTAGISGTLDQILTMALYFGMDSKAELEQGRLACLGWMLDSQDHSINEIMTASKGFGLKYVMGADSYSQIYPQDEQFVEKLKESQVKRGSDLPIHFLSKQWVEKKAGEMNTSLWRRRG
jgi:hypothetical protein